LLGHKDSEVSKRIDIFATALFHKMTVESLNDLDLSYTPPLSSPWDPVQMGAQAWQAEATRMKQSQNEVRMWGVRKLRNVNVRVAANQKSRST